ncbi:MAG TPA: rubrerythrin family protein [Bacillota bacterium]|nr:rubrerythrin family protein [Bacillota bacterium]
MSTENNLKTAFAGESQANRKYLAFAAQAEADGYPGVAKLFRAAAEAETIHAMSELKALGLVKDTASNLKAAIAGETDEFTNMYPGFIEEAAKEGNAQAKRAFEMANAAEKVHADLYTAALSELEQKQSKEYYVCSVCGNIHEGSAPDKCSICGAPASKFKNVG